MNINILNRDYMSFFNDDYGGIFFHYWTEEEAPFAQLYFENGTILEKAEIIFMAMDCESEYSF